MSPELETAIKERIELGHSKDQITDELRGAGYDDATIEHVYNSVSGEGPVTTIPSVMLASAADMLKSAWGFTTSRLDLVALAAVPTFLVSFASVGLEAGWFALGLGLVAVFVVGYLVVLGLQIALQIVIIHAAVNREQGADAPLSVNWSWMTAHFFSAFWVSALVLAVVFGGMLLLIIPGLIASIYLMFSLYALVDEGLTGMAALKRSHQIVRGNIWDIIWRFLVLLFLVFVVAIIIGLIVAVIASIANVSGDGGIVAMLFNAVFNGFFTVLGIGFVAALYNDLKVRASVEPVAGTYLKVFGWLGVVAIVGFLTLAAIGLVAGYQELSGNGFDLEAMVDSPELDAAMDEMTPEEQAEFEAFMEQFGEELGDGGQP